MPRLPWEPQTKHNNHPDECNKCINRAQAVASTRGSPWLAEASDAFFDVRKHLARHSGEEIDAAIDEAVEAVRSQRA